MWTWKGEGVRQMAILLLHKPNLVKWSTKGRGGIKNVQKAVHVVYGCSLNAFILIKQASLIEFSID